jgi:hypothetical protein
MSELVEIYVPSAYVKMRYLWGFYTTVYVYDRESTVCSKESLSHGNSYYCILYFVLSRLKEYELM